MSAKSLSTPLARGTLALPMLLMFAALGASALRSQPVMPPVQVVKAELMTRLCEGVSSAPELALAHAPADLGQLVVRWRRPCRS